jgi:hypothetical protein
MLPLLVPTARVLLFSYNSAAFFEASNSQIGDHGITLLERLQAHRTANVRFFLGYIIELNYL